MKSLIKKLPHNEIAVFALLFFMVGLLYSRAFMSIGMIVLLGNALLNVDIKNNFRSFIGNHYLVLFTTVFIIYAISGLWSSDFHEFYDRTRVKIPYVALPFACVVLRNWKEKYFQFVFAFFIFIVLLGIGYSLYHYILDKDAIDAGYGVSHIMPTPFKNDHIRFSLAVVISFIFCIYFLMQSKNRLIQGISILLAIFQFIYIHILAVKTGFFCLYFSIFILLLYFIIVKKKYILGSVVGVAIFFTPIAMYKYSNTFKTKFHYTQYSIEQLLQPNASTHYSDIGRVVSYKLALKIIKKHKWIGVGAGDIHTAMQAEYTTAELYDAKVILPHNQWLMFYLTAGIGGFILFSLFVFYPFFSHYRKHLLFMLIWSLFLIPLCIEPLLETQYGVAIHILFLLLLVQFVDVQKKTIV